MKRRSDYKEFKSILEKYNIKKLYHFTDKSNIDSIIKNGGLYSWGDCRERGIVINNPGGSDISHELDEKDDLQYYIRVSLCSKHPMMFVAMQDGRIKNPVILEIDTDILLLENNIFSDKNAVKVDANKGNTIDDFKKIHFPTALKRNYFDIEDVEKDYYQAEILVKHHIPLHYILNISQYINPVDSVNEDLIIKPYTATINKDNPTAILFILNQSNNTANKVKDKDENAHSSLNICSRPCFRGK